jgi:hypothetical protein
VYGKRIGVWYRETGDAAARQYKLPVRFRKHPKDPTEPLLTPHIQRIEGTLEAALDGAEVVVTYNSNTAVESVLQGIVTLSFDEGSTAWDVTGHQIGDKIRPDRKDWMAKLAWKQWLLSEIAAGDPFKLEQPF